MRIGKAWTDLDSLKAICEFDLTDKRDFFQAVAESVLQCGCTTWTQMKRLE